MLSTWKQTLSAALAGRIRDRFGIEHRPVAEVPPRRSLGDLAFPAPLHLAKQLGRPPRKIAEELAEGWELPDGVRALRVEGAGYLNISLARSAFAARLLAAPPVLPTAPEGAPKIVVEHTNINPNKAAHVGHLRNAVLGDLLVRCLRTLGHPVEVQNYIDDTGVQLADVVVAFLDLQPTSLADIKAIPEPFDYVCWDLYARVGRWYEEDPARLELRRKSLHALEAGEGERAQAARLIARRIVGRHLRTMARLGIGYDLLTRESDILALHFFDHAFERLQESGAIRLEAEGKNAGCWVMPLAESAEFAGLEDPDKVIVRSDGTVTYVGKDIAYQLWKFGLLGRDFAYRYWMDAGVWETAREGAESPPAFGRAGHVINVIDARQSYLQKIVRAGLEALGHREAAESSVHFAYEMVSLSASTARQLGMAVAEEEGRSVEMSGRKGIGVKADDLLDRLVEKARDQVAKRHRELGRPELQRLAEQIASAALRFFMAKATTTRVIVFDLDEALAFEGETGPYLQYSLVRGRNIQRKLAGAGLPSALDEAAVAALPEELWSDDLWELVHLAAGATEAVEKAAATLELSSVARHALELAQRFHALYHHHPVLHEADPGLRAVRQAAFQAAMRALGGLCELLGIEEPERM